MGKDAYEELDMVDKMISCRGKGDVDIEILLMTRCLVALSTLELSRDNRIAL